MSNDDKAPVSPTEERTQRRAAPLRPAHPERVCWGCEKLCPAESLACGNGTIRTLHPMELFGEDWAEWFDQNDRK
jgi:hypothetical protein